MASLCPRYAPKPVATTFSTTTRTVARNLVLLDASSPVRRGCEAGGPEARTSKTLAPMRTFMLLAVHATMPPTIPSKFAPMASQRRPKRSDSPPNNRMLTQSQTVHTIENRLDFVLDPMSALMYVMAAAPQAKAQSFYSQHSARSKVVRRGTYCKRVSHVVKTGLGECSHLPCCQKAKSNPSKGTDDSRAGVVPRWQLFGVRSKRF